MRENLTHGLVREGKPTRRWRGGFTLVELLVVIAIISILAAMLLPALEESRRHALRVSCMTRLKQWGVLHMTYAGDARDLLPYRYREEAQHGGGRLIEYGVSFVRAVEEYGCTYDFAQCTEPWLAVESTREDLYDSTPVHWTYAYFGWFTPDCGGGPATPRRLTDAEDDQSPPRQSILMADVNRFGSLQTSYGANHVDPDWPYSRYYNDYWGFLSGPLGMNICWIDGHVRWMRWDAVDTTNPLGGLHNNYYWE